MKGYKVFNPDWTCRDFKYKVGEVYEIKRSPKCCAIGFHFCEKMSDCFDYYEFHPDNKVAEIEALGEIDADGTKSCTNKIKIVREIPWDELLNMVNLGKNNTGLCNTGNHNAGGYNSGHRNSGNCNTGNYNTGDCNTGNHNAGFCNSGRSNAGDLNSGNCNTGNYNTGDCNTGNHNAGFCNVGHYNIGNHNTGNHNAGFYNAGSYNTGSWNSGDWNISSFNNGCFNTVESTIMLFNQPSNWTYRDWINSDAKRILNQIPNEAVEWIWSEDMTDEEKTEHPEHETTGGYLKTMDISERGQIWWDGLTDEEKEIVRSIPNFDKTIFEEITCIKIDGKEEKESEE